MSEIPPPANPSFLQSILPVAELPGQPPSDRQPAQDGSQQAPTEAATVNQSAGHTDPAVNLSESIARLLPGAQLEIQSAGVNLEAQPLVRADSGHVFIDVGQNLAPAVQYVVEIISVGTPIQAAILTANGDPVTGRPVIQLQPEVRVPGQIGTTYQPAPGALLPESPIPAQVLAGPAIATGNRLNAILITRQNEPGASPTPVIAGSALTVQVIGLTVPAAIGPAKPVSPNSATQPGAPPALAKPVGPAHGRVSPINRARAVAQLFRNHQPGGRTAGVQPPSPATAPTPVQAIPPPDNPLATAATVATIIKGAPVAAVKAGIALGMPGSVITGIAVTSAQDTSTQNTSASKPAPSSAAGSQLLRTPIGLLRLNASEGLALGSTVALEVLSTRSPEEVPLRETVSPLLNLTATWPLLDEVIETLAATDPALAAQTIQRAFPAPTPRIGATLLFFMAALSLGDARNWLGQAATAALENAGRHDLLRRLAADFTRLRRAADEPTTRDPGSSEWRPTVFPFLDGGLVRPLTLFTRHGHHHDEDDETATETRFVLDVSLSALGPVQFDGLVRNDQFDLMVRSQKPFPGPMRDDIRQLFHQAMESTQLRGEVQFQTVTEFTVSPKDDYFKSQGQISDSMVV